MQFVNDFCTELQCTLISQLSVVMVPCTAPWMGTRTWLVVSPGSRGVSRTWRRRAREVERTGRRRSPPTLLIFLGGTSFLLPPPEAHRGRSPVVCAGLQTGRPKGVGQSGGGFSRHRGNRERGRPLEAADHPVVAVVWTGGNGRRLAEGGVGVADPAMGHVRGPRWPGSGSPRQRCGYGVAWPAGIGKEVNGVEEDGVGGM